MINLKYYTFLLTHNSQRSRFGQFAFNTFKDLEFRAIQLTAVNGAVSWADPVQLLLFIVNREAWKQIKIMLLFMYSTCATLTCLFWAFTL